MQDLTPANAINKSPESALNIERAKRLGYQTEGLTYLGPGQSKKKRGKPRSEYKDITDMDAATGTQVDEVPPACCEEGGKGNRFLNPISASDNMSGGGQTSAPLKQLEKGDKFDLRTRNIPDETLKNMESELDQFNKFKRD